MRNNCLKIECLRNILSSFKRLALYIGYLHLLKTIILDWICINTNLTKTWNNYGLVPTVFITSYEGILHSLILDTISANTLLGNGLNTTINFNLHKIHDHAELFQKNKDNSQPTTSLSSYEIDKRNEQYQTNQRVHFTLTIAIIEMPTISIIMTMLLNPHLIDSWFSSNDTVEKNDTLKNCNKNGNLQKQNVKLSEQTIRLN